MSDKKRPSFARQLSTDGNRGGSLLRAPSVVERKNSDRSDPDISKVENTLYDLLEEEENQIVRNEILIFIIIM